MLVNNLLGRLWCLGKGRLLTWPLTAPGWIPQLFSNRRKSSVCAGLLSACVMKTSSLPRQYGVWPSDLIFEGWIIRGDQWLARAEDKETLVTKRRPQRKGKCFVALALSNPRASHLQPLDLCDTPPLGTEEARHLSGASSRGSPFRSTLEEPLKSAKSRRP